MNLSRFNPFPIHVWILMFVSLLAGFFLGGVIQSLAIKQDTINTCEFLRR